MLTTEKIPKDTKTFFEKLHKSKKIPIALIYPVSKVEDGKIKKNPKKIIYIDPNETDIEKYDNNDVTMYKLSKVEDYVFINNELKKNPNKCSLCNKNFSNKSNTKRHILNSCPFKKINIKVPNFENKTNEIILKKDEEILCQFPNPGLRDIIYIAGPQGSGKSTYTKNYITEFSRLFPPIVIEQEESEFSESYDYSSNSEQNIGDYEKSIYLISRIDNDKSFRDLIDENVLLPVDISDPELIINPLDAKLEMPNSLIIFDDYELLDKSIQKSIEITLKDVILNGRDQAEFGNDIYTVITSHQLTDYKRTRDILYESSSITIFPKATPKYHLNRVLKNYCGLGKADIEKILLLPGRWVTIYKRYPSWILYKGGVFRPS